MRAEVGRLLLNLACACLFAVMIWRAVYGPIWYDGKETGWVAEFESIVLPAISVQYRGTIFVDEVHDLKRAKIDFPEVYRNVNGFKDLRANGLIMSPRGGSPFIFRFTQFVLSQSK